MPFKEARRIRLFMVLSCGGMYFAFLGSCRPWNSACGKEIVPSVCQLDIAAPSPSCLFRNAESKVQGCLSAGKTRGMSTAEPSSHTRWSRFPRLRLFPVFMSIREYVPWTQQWRSEPATEIIDALPVTLRAAKK